MTRDSGNGRLRLQATLAQFPRFRTKGAHTNAPWQTSLKLERNFNGVGPVKSTGSIRPQMSSLDTRGDSPPYINGG